MFAALLDTCTLWPSRQRDFLLSLAIEGAYRPLWSEAVLGELHYSEIEKLVERGESEDTARESAARLLEQLRRHFDDAIVENWEHLEGTYSLPDRDDEHVVAAAVIGGAGVIVTNNLKDFPVDKMPQNLDVQTPAHFAENQVCINPTAGVTALKVMSSRLGNNGLSQTPERILDLLVNRYQMVGVRRHLAPLL